MLVLTPFVRFATLALALGAALFSVLAPGTAEAKAHLWHFTEVFSNADGTVQFIEMQVTDPNGTAEWQTNGLRLESNAHFILFPNNLPNQNTFGRWMLIATPGFAALPGMPAPDFMIPANFFNPAGDQLVYRTTIDILTIPAGALPTDGYHSIDRNLVVGIASPINFAGALTLPISPRWGLVMAALLLGLVLLVALRTRRRSA